MTVGRGVDSSGRKRSIEWRTEKELKVEDGRVADGGGIDSGGWKKSRE